MTPNIIKFHRIVAFWCVLLTTMATVFAGCY